MKTNTSLKIFKLPTLVLIAMAIEAALLAQPVFAVPVHKIVLTENSSTSLSATFDGSTTGITVTKLGSEHWIVTFPATVFLSLTRAFWVEPKNSALGNAVVFNPSNSISVVGDAITNFTPVADKTIVKNVGVDTRDQVSISATFDDDAARAETVPETGSTFGPLFLSLIALLGAMRLRSLRLA
jgi:hypothetical protein